MIDFITIFTPIFNRQMSILKLYETLENQKNKSFKWLIIDDGSTDSLKKWVFDVSKKSNFEIIYKYQKNHGKHFAFNQAIDFCETNLFFCVDSDDYLTDNSIEIIYKSVNDKSFLEDNIAGLIAYRGWNQNNIIGTPFRSNLITSKIRDLYNNGKKGDTAIVFKTKVLKKYRFPYFANENFLRESILYNQIDNSYYFFILPKIIYITEEYRDDGLSKNARKLDFNSPIGASIFRYNNYLYTSNKFRNFIAYCYYYTIVYINDKKNIAKYDVKHFNNLILFVSILLFSPIYIFRFLQDTKTGSKP